MVIYHWLKNNNIFQYRSDRWADILKRSNISLWKHELWSISIIPNAWKFPVIYDLSSQCSVCIFQQRHISNIVECIWNLCNVPLSRHEYVYIQGPIARLWKQWTVCKSLTNKQTYVCTQMFMLQSIFTEH